MSGPLSSCVGRDYLLMLEAGVVLEAKVVGGWDAGVKWRGKVGGVGPVIS